MEFWVDVESVDVRGGSCVGWFGWLVGLVGWSVGWLVGEHGKQVFCKRIALVTAPWVGWDTSGVNTAVGRHNAAKSQGMKVTVGV